MSEDSCNNIGKAMSVINRSPFLQKCIGISLMISVIFFFIICLGLSISLIEPAKHFIETKSQC